MNTELVWKLNSTVLFLFFVLVLVSRAVRYRRSGLYVIKEINDAEIENNRHQKQSATLPGQYERH